MIAGLIDSIAGGGGLVTLPTFTLVLGPGPQAIGTNKVAASIAAGVALMVYARAGHVDWKRSSAFALWIALGSLSGSFVAPLIPVHLFKWFLAVTCPLILWVVWRKDLWVARELSEHPHQGRGFGLFDAGIVASGLITGFYDGVWGPGGGTFMFLSLLFVAKLPLLQAMGAAKFANTASALISLGSYASQGVVHWREGLIMGSVIGFAAFLGARYATKNAVRIVRPILAVVVLLLMFKLFRD